MKEDGKYSCDGIRHGRIRGRGSDQYKRRKRINQRVGDEIHIKYVLDLRDFPGDPIQEKIIHDFEYDRK